MTYLEYLMLYTNTSHTYVHTVPRFAGCINLVLEPGVRNPQVVCKGRLLLYALVGGS